jgi:hypothetical protein
MNSSDMLKLASVYNYLEKEAGRGDLLAKRLEALFRSMRGHPGNDTLGVGQFGAASLHNALEGSLKRGPLTPRIMNSLNYRSLGPLTPEVTAAHKANRGDLANTLRNSGLRKRLNSIQ